jgi:hypothetical protein
MRWRTHLLEIKRFLRIILVLKFFWRKVYGSSPAGRGHSLEMSWGL